MELFIVTAAIVCLLLVISVVTNISLYLCRMRKSIGSESMSDGIANIGHELNQTNVTQSELVSNQSVATHYDIGRIPQATIGPGDALSSSAGESDGRSYEHPYSILVYPTNTQQSGITNTPDSQLA